MKNLSSYNMTKQISIFLLITAILGMQSCCKCDDPTNLDCPNYDACYEVEEPIADFGAGFKYYFEGEEGCKLTLSVSNQQISAEDDNTCGYYGGANVYFSGTLNQK